MFQLEVANRIVAVPNTKQYGRLSLFSQFHSNPSLEFRIPKTSFFPIPKVESALVKFQKNFKNCDEYNSVLFQDIIKKSFQGRRKMIKNTLAGYDFSSEVKNSIDFTRRPETISPEEFALLTKSIL